MPGFWTTGKIIAMRKLTLMQQRFVQEYLVDGNATQAAIRAGYKGASAVVAVSGSRLLRSANVAQEIQAREMARTEELELARANGSAATAWLTSGWLLAKVRGIMDQALAAGNYAAANKSAELLGRHLRMWSDDDSAKRSGPVLNVKRVEVYLDRGTGSPPVIDAKVLDSQALPANDDDASDDSATQ